MKYRLTKMKQGGRREATGGSHSLLLCNLAPLSTAPFFLTFLSYDVQVFFLSLSLDAPSLVNLDEAVSKHEWRPYWITLLHSVRSAGIDEWCHSCASLTWLTRRGICARRMQMKVDGWRVRGCDLLLLQTIDIVDLGRIRIL